jgi:hypothetical protein
MLLATALLLLLCAATVPGALGQVLGDVEMWVSSTRGPSACVRPDQAQGVYRLCCCHRAPGWATDRCARCPALIHTPLLPAGAWGRAGEV